TAAGYPVSNKLPKTYRNPPPEAAAPAEKPLAKSNDQTSSQATQVRSSDTALPPPAGNAPPGFRF
ncbi:MAG TPA: glutaredoxin family protein, partial [Noviherbaspirillum sp.]|nr:glutaredoxin family protein [Noviherbaspirillum sp.]